MKAFKKVLLDTIKGFNEIGHKSINGKINKNEFKGILQIIQILSIIGGQSRL